MMRLKKLGFIQLGIVNGDLEGNFQNLKKQLASKDEIEDSLLVLPELWLTGFDYPKLAQHVSRMSDFITRLEMLATKYNTTFTGSYPEFGNDGNYYNSLKITTPTGTFGDYHKQYLFPGEEEFFSPAAKARKVLFCPDFKENIAGIICFDLRFPEISRRLCQQETRVLICTAQWPRVRIQHWKSLLVARAIENQLYVVGCNGGCSPAGVPLGGNSLVISPDGEILAEGGEGVEVKNVAVDWEQVDKVRSVFNTAMVTL